MKNYRLKDFEKAVLFGLIFSIILSLASFDTGCEDLRKNVLRLHIIANSDCSDDQSVKLLIRDGILTESKDIFDNCTDLNEAEKKVSKQLKTYESIADNILIKNGFNYKASAELKDDWFDTREYEDFTLPAGTYRSLTVTLGSGKGHNWWCVIYPTVCLGSTSKALTKTVNKNGYKVATGSKKYICKFKAVEIYERIKKKIRIKK